MNLTSRLLLACLGAFFFVAAWADCVTREPTAKEIDFHKGTYAALRSALAPAPDKWTLKVEPERQPGSNCNSDAEGRFSVTLSASSPAWLPSAPWSKGWSTRTSSSVWCSRRPCDT